MHLGGTIMLHLGGTEIGIFSSWSTSSIYNLRLTSILYRVRHFGSASKWIFTKLIINLTFCKMYLSGLNMCKASEDKASKGTA